MMNIVFETDRLLLCTFNANESELIYELNHDPDVTRYTCDPIVDRVQAKRVLEEVILPQYALYNYGRWATRLKQSLTFIGWCGLKCRPERNEVDLGYRFIKKFWGKGYATEAASATLRYGFNQLDLPNIIARALPGNVASIKVLEKCGMRYLGEEFIDGHLHRTYQASKPAIQS